jgi:hypothetical protein
MEVTELVSCNKQLNNHMSNFRREKARYFDIYLWNCLAASGTRVTIVSCEQVSLRLCNNLALLPLIHLHLPSIDFSLIKDHAITPGGNNMIFVKSQLCQ